MKTSLLRLALCGFGGLLLSACHESAKLKNSTAAEAILHAPLPPAVPFHSPNAIVPSPDSKSLYMTELDQHLIRVIDAETLKTIRTVPTPAYPSGIVKSPDGCYFLTAGVPNGLVVKYNGDLKVVSQTLCGHSPMAPAVSPDGKIVAVCDRFKNRILFFDSDLNPLGETGILREPMSALFTLDGKKLFVANALPDGPADVEESEAKITVISIPDFKVKTQIKMINGALNLRQMCLSHDGKFLIVPFVATRFQIPTSRIDRAWLAANSIALIDTEDETLLATVPVDDPQMGFTNPYAVWVSPDGETLCILGAGSHELITLPYPKLMLKINERMTQIHSPRRGKIKPPPLPEDDLGFIRDIRIRRKLDLLAPRTLTQIGNKLYIPGYYSDSLNVVDLTLSPEIPPQSELYGVEFSKLPQARRGELYFSDGRLCLQQWLSCITCHPDGRADGVNWDLVNDGIGNPKNTKSMLYSIYTPPAMSTGIRPDAEYAIRSGVTHIQFHKPLPEEAVEIYPAIEEYYREMKPVISPYRNADGTMSESALHGEKVFEKAGCTVCHNGPYLTNMQLFDVGTTYGMDKGRPLDTPTLYELWRTSPYMHDGRTTSLKDVITKHNPMKRGNTQSLSEKEVDDLVQYLLSL